MSSGFLTSRRTVGLRDILWMFLAPRRLFAKIENVTAYGWPLIVLLTTVTLIGYATVQTGLIDREVEKSVQQEIAKLDMEQADVVQRSEISKKIEDIKKGGEFNKLMTRMGAIVLEPIRMLSSILLLSAFFYGLVALSGKKPEWHTLMTIAVFASFIDCVRMIFELVLKLKCATLAVDTSAGSFVKMFAGQIQLPQQVADIAPSLLSGFDPFRIWFWMVTIMGLKATSQLRGWRAWLPCLFIWLGGAGVRTGLSYATIKQQQQNAGDSGVRIEVSDAADIDGNTTELILCEIPSEPAAQATGRLADSSVISRPNTLSTIQTKPLAQAWGSYHMIHNIVEVPSTSFEQTGSVST